MIGFSCLKTDGNAGFCTCCCGGAKNRIFNLKESEWTYNLFKLVHPEHSPSSLAFGLAFALALGSGSLLGRLTQPGVIFLLVARTLLIKFITWLK